MAEQAVALADRVRDQILEAGAQENLGECCLWTGDLRTARACFERALALCEGVLPPALTQVYGFDLSILPRVCISSNQRKLRIVLLARAIAELTASSIVLSDVPASSMTR